MKSKEISYKISDATLRNWERLNKEITDVSFLSRANKTQSKKQIIPVEYIEKNIQKEAEKLMFYLDKTRPIEVTVNSLILKYLSDQNIIFKNKNKVS